MPDGPRHILLILCDQLSAAALSAYGNPRTQTPHLDTLLTDGVGFRDAFTNCPLCQPSRASLWTGRYPHETGIVSNGLRTPIPPPTSGPPLAASETIPETMPTLGQTFRDAGFRTHHFGKCHDAGALRGFVCAPLQQQPVVADDPTLPVFYDTRNDADTTQKTVAFLDDHAAADPYLAVCDLQNPHDICNWVGGFAAGQIDPVADDAALPPLPENFARDPESFRSLPWPVQYVCCAHVRQAQIADWDHRMLRHYLRAYDHYVHRVDAEVGRVLAALRRRPDADQTLVVFTADHGDSMLGRGLATKHCTFYEETMRVPLAFAGAGVRAADALLPGLCCLLDLVPTLCDAADLAPPPGLRGRSLWPLVQGRPAPPPPTYVVGQWTTEWGYTVEPGRMIRTDSHKYTHYLEGAGEELYDLTADPGEMHNLADAPPHHATLQHHRALLQHHLQTTGDDYLTQPHRSHPGTRQHPPGYHHHRGPAAPQLDDTSR